MAIVNVTLNPADLSMTHSLSNGNLTDITATNGGNIRATHGKNKGKWYWEVKLNSGGIALMIGIANMKYPITSTVYSGSNGDALNIRLYYGATGNKMPENTSYGSSWTVGDVIGVALDIDNAKLEFYKNGVSMGVSHTNIANMGEIFPIFRDGTTTTKTITVNFGATSFAYPIPSGYQAYNVYPQNKFLISPEDESIKSFEHKETKYILNMTSHNLPSPYVISASSEATGTLNYAWKAFDGSNESVSNSWSTSTNVRTGWIRVDFATSKKVNTVYLTSANTNSISNAAPSAFTIEGSSDGSNWIVLKLVAGEVNWIANETRRYDFESVEYRFYRINVSTTYNISNGGSASGTLSLGEILCSYIEKPKYISVPEKTENVFITYGMNKETSLSLDTDIDIRVFVVNNPTILGSGKVFKQTIDTSKIPIKKASIT